MAKADIVERRGPQPEAGKNDQNGDHDREMNDEGNEIIHGNQR
jgi:hypothetical protein